MRPVGSFPDPRVLHARGGGRGLSGGLHTLPGFWLLSLLWLLEALDWGWLSSDWSTHHTAFGWFSQISPLP